MNILIAPNAMKGSLSAFEMADAIEAGLQKAGLFDITKLPVADGGDGTARVLANVLGASFVHCTVLDPLLREIDSGFYLDDKNVAIIEMADASGMKLLAANELLPLKTSSFGTGQLVKLASEHGAKTIWLCVGGSATVDAGMGALMALGVKFFSSDGELTLGNGESMVKVDSFDALAANKLLQAVSIKIISDVKNPLLGENGAVAVFAPQKGASYQQLKVLEKGMLLFAKTISQQTGCSISALEGGGAAGGIAAAFAALFNAQIVDGAQFVLEKTGFYDLALHADLIITGEGKVDNSTLMGKAPGAILAFGTVIDKPVYVICGINSLSVPNRFKQIVLITSKIENLKETMSKAFENVVKSAFVLGENLKVDIDYNHALAAFENNEIEKSLLMVDQLIELDKMNTDLLLLKAKIKFKQQNWRETLNLLNAILEVDANNELALNYKKMVMDILVFWNKDNYNP